MQAIIFAAGKGTRLGALTAKTPKPMISMNGRPLLSHIITRLPRAVDEVIIAIGYRGEMIKTYFNSAFAGRKITYVDGSDFTGTAGALFKAREIVRGKFIVLNGDDVFTAKDLERLSEDDLAMGVFEGALGFPGYWHIEVDANGMLQGMRERKPAEAQKGFRIASGAFVLNERIFDYEPVRMRNGEYGLPQTVLNLAKKVPVAVVNMPSWRTITHPEDIPAMERYLASQDEDG